MAQKHNGGKTTRFGIPKHEDRQKIPTVHQGQAHNGSTDHLAPAFSFFHFDGKTECPSSWVGDDMRLLFDTLRVASSMTWGDVRKTGGHGGTATGVGFKPIPPGRCKRALPPTIAPDVDLAEMRVSKKARIFGVRVESVFYVIWLDRNHVVLPE